MYSKNSEWDKRELQYLRDNYLAESNQGIAKELGRSPKAVQVKLSKLGLKRPDKYSYNANFFDKIDGEEKAYWLGFLYADGYVCQCERNSEVGIELSARDVEHLRKFNKSLNGNISPSFKNRKESKIHSTDGVVSFRIYNKKMVEDLIKWGCTKNKTFSIKMPPIKDVELIWHFIRGYFDGDGSIYIDKTRDFIGFNFSSGSKEMLEQLRTFLYENGVYSYLSIEKRKDDRFDAVHECYKLLITGMNNAFTFGEKIYKNSTIFLDRKRQKFDNAVEQYNINERCKNRPYRRDVKLEQ